MGDIGLILLGVTLLCLWLLLGVVRLHPMFRVENELNFLRFVTWSICFLAMLFFVIPLALNADSVLNLASIAIATFVVMLAYGLELFADVSTMKMSHFSIYLSICFAAQGTVLYIVESDKVTLNRIFNITTFDAATGLNVPTYTFTADQAALMPVMLNIWAWLSFFCTMTVFGAVVFPKQYSGVSFDLGLVLIGTIGVWVVLTTELIQDSYGAFFPNTNMYPIAGITFVCVLVATAMMQLPMFYCYDLTIDAVMPGYVEIAERGNSAGLRRGAYKPLT